MKSSPLKAFASYGHVFLPGLAGILGLAAITSQWVDNHRLRTELEKTNAERKEAAHESLLALKVLYGKSRAYTEEMNKWIDAMNDFNGKGLEQVKEINQSTKEAINQRDAQSICSIQQAGSAAGVQWPGSTKEELIKEVIEGVYPPPGPFHEVLFKCGLEGSDLAGVAKYLKYQPGAGLLYDDSAARNNVSDAGKNPKPFLGTMPRMPKYPEFSWPGSSGTGGN